MAQMIKKQLWLYFSKYFSTLNTVWLNVTANSSHWLDAPIPSCPENSMCSSTPTSARYCKYFKTFPDISNAKEIKSKASFASEMTIVRFEEKKKSTLCNRVLNRMADFSLKWQNKKSTYSGSFRLRWFAEVMSVIYIGTFEGVWILVVKLKLFQHIFSPDLTWAVLWAGVPWEHQWR